MCNPAVVGLVVSGVQAKQQMDEADYQSGVDANNARLLSWQRADVMQRGAEQGGAVEAAGRRVASSTRAELDAGGIDSSTGSAADAVAASRVNAATASATIRANAVREAWGLESERQDLLTSSKFRRRASYLNALGTGVQGIGGALSYGARSRATSGSGGGGDSSRPSWNQFGFQG